jgi:hypothetical protein
MVVPAAAADAAATADADAPSSRCNRPPKLEDVRNASAERWLAERRLARRQRKRKRGDDSIVIVLLLRLDPAVSFF